MDALRPSTQLLLKLGAVVARADRYVSPAGSILDLSLLARSLRDPEVRAWIQQISRQLPANRTPFQI